jgi:hypothetical protein
LEADPCRTGVAMENDDLHYRRGGEAGPSQEGLGVSGLIASSAEWREGELRATPTRHSREGELRTPPRHLIIPGHQRVDSSASEVSLDEGRDLMHRDEGDLSMGIASSSSSGSSLENQLVTGSTMKKEFKIKVSPMRMVSAPPAFVEFVAESGRVRGMAAVGRMFDFSGALEIHGQVL